MTSGAEQLKDWIVRRFPGSERLQRDASEYFGWDETQLSKFLSGARRPGLDNAVVIERHTGIPVEAWMSSELDESDAVMAGTDRKRK